MIHLLAFLGGLGFLQQSRHRLPPAIVQKSGPETRESVGRELSREGTDLMAGGREREATESFRKALAADPNDLNALANLGILLLKRGQAAEAGSLFERGSQLRPEDPHILSGLALAYHDTERLDEAVAVIKRACSIDPKNPAIRRLLGEFLRDSGDA